MRLNIFNKKRCIKESEEVSQKKPVLPPEGKKVFIENLNNFMRNPNFDDPGMVSYINYITAICEYVNDMIEGKLNVNQGAAIRINGVSQSSITFKVFIYNKSSLEDKVLKHGGNIPSFSFHKDIEDKDAPLYNIKIMLRDTGYGKSDIPNFYIKEDDKKLHAKANGKLSKATEAAESLVAYYFNEISVGEGNGYLTGAPSKEITEAIGIISSDFEWKQSCKSNALGIINFLKKRGFKKGDFVAVHPSWIKTREKNIVINEYLDPSDIFLIEKQGFKTNEDNLKKGEYKNKCKEEFSTRNPRSLGVSLKKLKSLIIQSVEQDKPSEEIFETPNFFLTGWKLKSSPKVIYKKNPTELDLKSNNYFVSNIFIKVSSSRDPEDNTPGKTMKFNCIVNGKEKLLFTIRKNGGENFVLEAVGSEDTESQGGKCSKLIDFVVEDQHFKDSLRTAIKNFNLAQDEAKKLVKEGEGDPDIIEDEINSVDDVLQRINALQGFTPSKENVKKAAIAFAFAKKLPFLNPGDSTTENYIVEAYNTLGFKGNTYEDIKNASPIYLGLGKDAYYSGN